MRKSELMILWNVESWTVEPHGVYFVARQLVADGVANHEDHTIETQVENVEQAFKSFNISCSGYTEDEMLSLTFWPQLYAKLDELDRVAQKIIQKEMPPDDPVVLKLTDIMLDTSGCYGAFALGYDVGESIAGQLYVLVSFDENFTARQDVIYETL